MYIYIYICIYILNKGSEEDLFLFEANPPLSRLQWPGSTPLSNKWLAERAIQALPFDHLRAVSPCCCFPPSSCSCLKVEVIPPERNTLGVLQSINLFLLFLLFFSEAHPPSLNKSPSSSLLPLCGIAVPLELSGLRRGDPLGPGSLRRYHPARRGRPRPPLQPIPSSSPAGSRILQASEFACAAFCFLEDTHCFPLDAVFL